MSLEGHVQSLTYLSDVKEMGEEYGVILGVFGNGLKKRVIAVV